MCLRKLWERLWTAKSKFFMPWWMHHSTQHIKTNRLVPSSGDSEVGHDTKAHFFRHAWELLDLDEVTKAWNLTLENPMPDSDRMLSQLGNGGQRHGWGREEHGWSDPSQHGRWLGQQRLDDWDDNDWVTRMKYLSDLDYSVEDSQEETKSC